MAGPPRVWAPEGWNSGVNQGHHGERILRTNDDGRWFCRGLSGLPEGIVVAMQTLFPMSPRLRVSAADLPPSESPSGRGLGRFLESAPRCMRPSLPQRNRGAEFLPMSSRLSVSAGDFPPSESPSGRGLGRFLESASPCMRSSLPWRRGEAGTRREAGLSARSRAPYPSLGCDSTRIAAGKRRGTSPGAGHRGSFFGCSGRRSPCSSR